MPSLPSRTVKFHFPDLFVRYCHLALPVQGRPPIKQNGTDITNKKHSEYYNSFDMQQTVKNMPSRLLKFQFDLWHILHHLLNTVETTNSHHWFLILFICLFFLYVFLNVCIRISNMRYNFFVAKWLTLRSCLLTRLCYSELKRIRNFIWCEI